MATATTMSTNEIEAVKKEWISRLSNLIDAIKNSAEASG